MHRFLKAATVVAMVTIESAGIVQAADFQKPSPVDPGPQTTDEIENAMKAILRPIDIVTAPINTLMSPLTGPLSFDGALSAPLPTGYATANPSQDAQARALADQNGAPPPPRP